MLRVAKTIKLWQLRVPEGRLAQLVERFVYTEDVGSSSLSSPTIFLQQRHLRMQPIGCHPLLAFLPV